ncbi:MAG: hypothetical protein ACTSSE_11345 [Candidatus Thorarchaeota archaeon]
MNRKVVIAVAIVGVVVVAVLLPNLGNITGNSHYSYTGDRIDYVALTIEDLENAELSITFDDTQAAAYSVNIYQVPFSGRWGYTDIRTIADNASRIGARFVFTGALVSVNVVLRSDIEYVLSISDSVDIDTTIAAASSATINHIEYTSTGNLTLILDECETGAGGMLVMGDFLKHPENVYLSVDLPDDYWGKVTVNEPSIVTVMENQGWSFDGDDTYSSGSTGDIYNFQLFASQHIYLWLSD